ncbi:hypothetical protein DUNSADRAFT_17512 [Dunaliella salina]|uniref:Lipoyl-binding domain-containing protein n=1 Tax=Dunaliella salina TaxID=3046 RepID=A0ABQ7GZY3_DUNSA|nr:hypothetical protein DUNSADRAFT_17512 [Dunaliella salina]|eukprot:KAF5840165.1 hypothetical protein DUNSADRAFT_17512 [Dunaliella salina]
MFKGRKQGISTSEGSKNRADTVSLIYLCHGQHTASHHTLQVAGLPTNLQFLQRLCAHPAFVAADLDTGFLARHLPDLLTPQPIPMGVAALAGVARHLMQCLDHAPSTTSGKPSLGAWAIPDLKRLWYSGSRVFRDVLLPTQAVLSSDSSSNSNSKVDRLAIALTIRGQDSFEVQVEGLQEQEGEALCSSGNSSSVAGQNAILVKHAQLAADAQIREQMQDCSPGNHVIWKLEAEVHGCRMQADLVQFMRGQSEMVMCMWFKGYPESFEFRWPVLSWSRGLDAAAAAAAAPGSLGGKVTAPMPGKVAKVLVQDGDKVAVGQGLLALEAMKMEHMVVAPKSGIILQTSVYQDQQVSDGEVLMRIGYEGENCPGNT